MILSFKDQIIVILDRKKISKSKLAEMLNMSRQNFYTKLDRNNFTENEMQRICNVLNLKYTLTIEENEE